MIFRYEVISEAMKLLKITFPALSQMSGTSESTLKKLARGESENPGILTLYNVFKPLGLSIDRACGLAPERDIAKEAAEHNVSIAKALQERLAMQDEKIDALKEKIDGLKDLVSEKREEIAALKASIDAKDKSINHRDQIIRHKDRIIIILVCILAFIVIMDLMFANHGWFDFGLIK